MTTDAAMRQNASTDDDRRTCAHCPPAPRAAPRVGPPPAVGAAASATIRPARWPRREAAELQRDRSPAAATDLQSAARGVNVTPRSGRGAPSNQGAKAESASQSRTDRPAPSAAPNGGPDRRTRTAKGWGGPREGVERSQTAEQQSSRNLRTNL